MIDPDDAELIALRGEFCLLVARWRLTQAELQSLLGLEASDVEAGHVLPHRLASAAEHRVRLLLRLDAALRELSPGIEVASCLRAASGQPSWATPLNSLNDLRYLRSTLARAEAANQGDLDGILEVVIGQGR